MEDHEIATKCLTDWKPETDIKLQKSLGKLVEEIGELLEAREDFISFVRLDTVASFENEIADVYAFIRTIEEASNHQIEIRRVVNINDVCKSLNEHEDNRRCVLSLLSRYAAKSLNIIGRCQIQGLQGSDPETKHPNVETLSVSLSYLKAALDLTVLHLRLDNLRIERRANAKRFSKLSWIMGTATDLLPDV